MENKNETTLLPEHYDRMKFMEELNKSGDPDKMSWMMLNFLVQKMADEVSPKSSRYSGETARYGDGYYSDQRYPVQVGRRGGMNSMSRSYSRYGHDVSENRLHEAKEMLVEVIGREVSDEDIKCLIVKEAASLIKKISVCDEYDALKEFNELCMVMKAYADNMPEELERQAKEEAISGYARMFLGDSRSQARRIESRSENYPFGHDHARSGNPLIERSRLSSADNRSDYGRRGRSRDSMGRFI